MGGRATYAVGNNPPYSYEIDLTHTPDGKWEGVKVLKGMAGTNNHGLPESSHTSFAYIKLKSNGVFHEMRFYDENHVLYLEIGYHAEPRLTGNRHENVLHYHTYDDRFSKTKGAFARSAAKPLTMEMKEKYKKYFKGVIQ